MDLIVGHLLMQNNNFSFQSLEDHYIINVHHALSLCMALESTRLH